MSSASLTLRFISRELRNRFAGSFSGGLWALFQPLLQLAVYSFVFVHVFKARIPGADAPGYVPFLVAALWPWTAFAEAVLRSTTAIQDNAALIGKVAVPHALYVDTRVAGAALVDLAGFGVVLAALPLSGVDLAWSGLPVLVPALATVALWGLAAARALAVLQVFLRDIAAVIGQLLTLGFFLTPVLYDRTSLPAGVADALAFNPLAPPIEALRAALTGAPVAWPALAASALAGAGLLAAATLFMRRARSHLEDFL